MANRLPKPPLPFGSEMSHSIRRIRCPHEHVWPGSPANTKEQSGADTQPSRHPPSPFGSRRSSPATIIIALANKIATTHRQWAATNKFKQCAERNVKHKYLPKGPGHCQLRPGTPISPNPWPNLAQQAARRTTVTFPVHAHCAYAVLAVHIYASSLGKGIIHILAQPKTVSIAASEHHHHRDCSRVEWCGGWGAQSGAGGASGFHVIAGGNWISRQMTGGSFSTASFWAMPYLSVRISI